MSANRSIHVSILGFLIVAFTCLTIIGGTTWSAHLFGDRGGSSGSAAENTGREILIPLFAPDDDTAPGLRIDGIAASGRIVFSSDRILSIQKIFTIGGDGVGLTCLMCPGASDASGTGTADTSTGITPAFSPDGKTIAFVRSGQIWLMNSDGSGQPGNTNVTGSNPQWSPDGTKLVYSRNINASGAPNNEIFIVNRNGTGEVNVSNDAGNDVFPSWGAPVPNHPQGRISFRSTRTGDSEIFVISPITPSAPIKNVTNDPAFDSGAKWSSDGTKLVFYSYRDQPNGEIYTLNPDTAAVARLTNDSFADSFPAWSPDGLKIVFMRHTTSTQAGNYELFTVNPIPSTPLIAPGNLTNHPSADFDPSWGSVTTVANGKIAFEAFSSAAGVSQIYTIADAVGATPVLCGVGETREGRRPAFSHDGTKLAFMRSGTIWVANADCSNPQVNTGAAGDAPTWSPDGTKIAFVRGSTFTDIWTMNVDGSNQTRVTNSAAQTNPAASFSNGQPSWGSNNKIVFRALSSKIVDGASRSVGDIWTMEPGGTSFVRLTDDPVSAYAPDWSPDATKIVFASNRATNRGELYIMTAAGAGQTRITNDASISNSNPAWSPDGTKIVHDDDFSRITRRDSAGSNGVVLTTGTFPDWQATTASANTDLFLTMGGPSQIVQENTAQYVINVVNRSSVTATNVRIITDALPNSVQWVPSGSSNNCLLGSDRKLTCTIGTVQLDTGSTIINLKPTGVENFTFKAKAESDQAEATPDPNPNFASIPVMVTPSSDMAISLIETPPATVNVGQNITYRYFLTNNGPSTAEGVVFQHGPLIGSLPSNVEFVPSLSTTLFNCRLVSGIVVCDGFGTIDAGSSRSITIVVRTLGPGNVNHSARVSVNGSTDRISSNNSVSLATSVETPRADLSIAVEYSPNIINNTVRVGDEYSVFFTVRNNGPATATTAVLIFATKAGVENVPANTDSRCATTPPNELGQTLFVCSLGNLANGASVNQLRVALKALAAGARTDTASVTANELDPPGNCVDNPTANHCATTGGQINGAQADLEFLADFPSQATVGENLSVSFWAKNHGPSIATNVAITVRRDPGSDFVSISGPNCVDIGAAFYKCTPGNLAPGASSPHIVLTVIPRTSGATQFSGSTTANESQPVPDPHPNDTAFTVNARSIITVKGLEVTQAVQDLRNSVPLLAGKRTVVRAYVQAPDALTNNARISATLKWTNSPDGNIRILVPSNSGGEVKVLQAPDRGQLNDSFYFELPDSWTQAGAWNFKLESSTPLRCEDPDGVPDCTATVNFRNPQNATDVRFYSLGYTAGNSTVIPSATDVNRVIAEFKSMLPIRSLVYDSFDWATPAGVGKPTTFEEFTLVNDQLLTQFKLDCKNKPSVCSKQYVGLLRNPAGTNALGMANDIPGDVCSTYIDDRLTPSHELGHSLGLRHTNVNNLEPGPEPHTPADGTISTTKEMYDPKTIYGFDVYDTGSYMLNNPGRIYGPNTGNFMGYGAPRPWISEHSYTRLLSSIQGISGSGPNTRPLNAPRAPVGQRVNATDVVVLSGIVPIAPDYVPKFSSVYLFNSPGLVELPVPGSYAVQLETTAGAVLATHSFEPEIPSGTEDFATFNLMLPWDTNARRIRIIKNGQTVLTREASQNAPIVNVTSPNGGETLNGANAQLQWTASDGDGDPLNYLLQFSDDGGATWRVLIANLNTTTYDLNLSSIGGTTQGLIRVTASDGFNTSQDQSNAIFTVPARGPQSTISSPPNDGIFVGDQTIILRGSSYDAEDGPLPGAGLRWTSNLNGDLGVGEALPVNASTLQEGTHTITLTATDATSRSGTASISIKVFRTRPTFPAELSVGATDLTFDTSFGSGPIAPQPLAIRNGGDGNLAWTATTDQPWLQLASAAGNAPSNVDVTINPVGLPPGTYTGTVTINAATTPATSRVVNASLTIAAGPPSTIGGRVLTPDGRGLRNAVVSLVNSQGVSLTATTSSFGIFSFASTPDDYYTVRISSKRYRFAVRTVQISNDATLTDFVGLE